MYWISGGSTCNINEDIIIIMKVPFSIAKKNSTESFAKILDTYK
jgi:hypothetical protein